MCSLQTLVYWLIGLAVMDVVMIIILLSVYNALDQMNDRLNDCNDLQGNKRN